MASKIEIMAITTISSISVKPCLACLRMRLPILVLCAIEGRSVGFRIDIENVLPTPGIRIRVVFGGAQPPIGGAGHGIDGDPPQKAISLAVRLDPFDERLQIRRIPVAAQLYLKGAAIGGVFVTVNGRAHRAQVIAQFLLFLPLHRDARQRQRHRGQHQQQRDGHDQLHQREAGGASLLPCRLAYRVPHCQRIRIVADAVPTWIGSPEGFRATTRLTEIVVTPAALARKVITRTAPEPEMPPALAPRLALICVVPVVGSFRCATATTWPSFDKKPPFTTFCTSTIRGS